MSDTTGDEMRAALKPFADRAYYYDETNGNNGPEHDSVEARGITVGDLRQARVIYQELDAPSPTPAPTGGEDESELRGELILQFTGYLSRMKAAEGECGPIDLAGVAMKAFRECKALASAPIPSEETYEAGLARLKERLFGNPNRKVVNFHFTPGPNATPEGVVREINRVLDQIERGDCEIIEDLDAPIPSEREDAELRGILDRIERRGIVLNDNGEVEAPGDRHVQDLLGTVVCERDEIISVLRRSRASTVKDELVSPAYKLAETAPEGIGDKEAINLAVREVAHLRASRAHRGLDNRAITQAEIDYQSTPDLQEEVETALVAMSRGRLSGVSVDDAMVVRFLEVWFAGENWRDHEEGYKEDCARALTAALKQESE